MIREMDSTLGAMGCLPAEIMSRICQSLSLEDIVRLQVSHPHLDTLIDNVFFSSLQKMRITWDESGAVVVLSPRRNHSYLKNAYSVPADSDWVKPIIKKALAVDSLTLSLSDHNKDYKLLEVINDAGIHLQKVVVNIRTPRFVAPKKMCKATMNRSHRKLTEFVQHQSEHLQVLKVSTSNEDTVVFDLRPPRGAPQTEDPIPRVEYSHNADSQMQQSLILPIFKAFNFSKPGPSAVSLTVDWNERLDLALQSTFLVALPYLHRAKVRALKIGFSKKLSTLSSQEIHNSLEAFSSSLQDTFNLKELICDFTASQLDPHQLESTIKAISGHLASTHRIRFLLDRPQVYVDEAAEIRRHWNTLPKVY